MSPVKHSLARAHVRTWMSWAIVSLLLLAPACEPQPRFGDLSTADRLELNTNKLVTITDRSQIRDAAAFFARYRAGWTNSWSGGASPLYINFLKGNEKLASFGVGPNFLTVGTMTRQVQEDEIATLAKRLDLTWPRPR
jgi:hypothetical protein